jgi:uncharacterized protein (DUF488 family)
MTVFTIGHSTRTLDLFIALLVAAVVDCLVDVRRFPGSRRYPHFNADVLGPALATAGITYRPLIGLGGRRGRRCDGPSPHTLWRVGAFRNYADYAESDEFRAEFTTLRSLAAAHHVAIMCAEAVWWRCHRRIISDYLIAAGATVEHILDAHKVEPARLTPGAVARPDGTILYRAETLI